MDNVLLIIIVLIIAYFVHKQLCKQGIDVVSEGIVIIKKPLNIVAKVAEEIGRAHV